MERTKLNEEELRLDTYIRDVTEERIDAIKKLKNAMMSSTDPSEAGKAIDIELDNLINEMVFRIAPIINYHQ